MWNASQIEIILAALACLALVSCGSTHEDAGWHLEEPPEERQRFEYDINWIPMGCCDFVEFWAQRDDGLCVNVTLSFPPGRGLEPTTGIASPDHWSVSAHASRLTPCDSTLSDGRPPTREEWTSPTQARGVVDVVDEQDATLGPVRVFVSDVELTFQSEELQLDETVAIETRHPL